MTTASTHTSSGRHHAIDRYRLSLLARMPRRFLRDSPILSRQTFHRPFVVVHRGLAGRRPVYRSVPDPGNDRAEQRATRPAPPPTLTRESHVRSDEDCKTEFTQIRIEIDRHTLAGIGDGSAVE